MDFELSITKNFSEGDLRYLFTDSDMRQIQNAMAFPLADIVYNNFGYSGQDRPVAWPALSGKYAKEYHMGDITPTLQLTGALQSSIQIEQSNGEYTRVFTDNEYAAMHQWGIPGQLHARPFFPLYGDENYSELTPFAESEVVGAAQMEVERILSR